MKDVIQAEPRRSVSRAELAFALFGLTFYQGAFVSSFRYMRGDDHLLAGETEITGTIAQVIIMVGLVPALWRHRDRLHMALRDISPYLLIILICGLSVAWSAFPFATGRRTVTLTVCIAYGLWCCLALGLSRTLALIARVTAVLGAISIVVFIAFPSVGRETALGYENAMRGVFSQKNTLGAAMLLAISCYVFEIIGATRGRWRTAPPIIFMLGCQVLAKSATSILLSLAVLGFGLAVLCRRDWRLHTVFIFLASAIVLAIATVMVIDSTAVFNLMGRDLSFTGRLPLWQMSLQAAWQRPLLGYGYSGFWTQDSRIVQYIWALIEWQAPSAHNGYLDIVLQIGVIGLFVYMWMWGRVIHLAWQARKDRAVPEANWILLFMLINIVLNTDEGPLPYPDQFTLLMPGAMIFLETWRRNQRGAAAPAQAARVASPLFVRPQAVPARRALFRPG